MYQLNHIICLWCCKFYGHWQLCHCAWTFIIPSLQVAWDNTENVLVLGHLVLAKKWGTSLKKAFNMICCTAQCDVLTILHSSLLQQSKTNNHQFRYRQLPCIVYIDTLFANPFTGEYNKHTKFFATDFCWSHLLLVKLKSETHDYLFSLNRTGCCLQ